MAVNAPSSRYALLALTPHLAAAISCAATSAHRHPIIGNHPPAAAGIIAIFAEHFAVKNRLLLAAAGLRLRTRSAVKH